MRNALGITITHGLFPCLFIRSFVDGFLVTNKRLCYSLSLSLSLSHTSNYLRWLSAVALESTRHGKRHRRRLMLRVERHASGGKLHRPTGRQAGTMASGLSWIDFPYFSELERKGTQSLQRQTEESRPKGSIFQLRKNGCRFSK